MRPAEHRIVTLSDGQRVGVATYGDPSGRPVLALHGTPATHLMFRIAHQIAADNGLKLIAPDRPGYGSTPIDQAPTLASRAEALERLADALGLDRFAVLGISGGAPTATALAARLGARAAALALVSPVGPIAETEAQGAPLPRGHHSLFVEMPLHHPHMLHALAVASAGSFRWAPHLSLKSLAWTLGGNDHDILVKPHVETLMIAMTHDAIEHGIEGAIADLGMFARPWDLDWTRITAPTIVWQGTDDAVVPPAATYLLAGRIAGARLEKIEGAGHFWILDHIPDVLGALAATLGATAARA